MIPLSEKHLRKILWEWATHYNRGRPHASLGAKNSREPPDCRVRIKDVLAGLHHEYSSESEAA